MLKRIGWTAAILMASALSAWAQCPNCGKYHGGAPSSGSMTAEADKKASEIDAMMKRFQEKEAAMKKEYQTAAAARIAEIQSQQEAQKAAIAASKREEILNRKSAEAMKKLEEAQKQGAAAGLSPQDRAAAVGQVKTLTGTESARERMKLNETNKALEQLQRKEHNDRPAPKSIEQVPDKAIFNNVVTPFERAKQKLSNIFDNSDYVDPTKE